MLINQEYQRTKDEHNRDEWGIMLINQEYQRTKDEHNRDEDVQMDKDNKAKNQRKRLAVLH
ncbi:hypothetical protein H5410_063562 [Solanum commersonii]|uniref:Uncharacterized protein n=1 Tax=Solanum commersonii TaxID=4109 RepID=A0A9J5WEW4_SOLCO|nr:hypothetical protein H5410_063562 [Solanum commersonii]